MNSNTDDKSKSSCFETYISEKEKRDGDISLHLRERGIITKPGTPFAESRKKEMDSLPAKGVYKIIDRHAEEIRNTRIFGSRIIYKVKVKELAVPYEKSRLIIQALNDQDEKTVLTQSATIQRASQQLILAIAHSLRNLGIKLFLKDITQSYVQSKSQLARPICAWPPKEMKSKFTLNFILKIIKPLYGIPELSTHRFGTYHTHHQKNLCMTTSTYILCLLITNVPNGLFVIVGMQTDDTLILGDQDFIEKEKIRASEGRSYCKIN